MATSSYDGGWIISGEDAGEKLNEAFTRALSMSTDDMNVPDFDELLENGRKHLESWKTNE